ncbi:MAG: RsmE family RNA methyltransferase [Thermoanaerobaculia bacterium]
MPFARLFVERLPAPGERLRVAGEEAAHARARRLSPGDPVRLFDGSGREATARVARLSRAGLEMVAERILEPAGAGPPVALLVAGARPERLSWIAEKAAELSVARLLLVRTQRTQSFRASEALRGRLERVARAAAKQCGAPRWPQILGPLPAAEALARESAAHRLLLDPDGEPFPAVLLPASAALAVGPEGGWTRAEVETARLGGWAPTALPAGRLRAETAAVAGLVLLRAALSRGNREP